MSSPASSPTIDLVEEAITVRLQKGASVTTARLVRPDLLQEADNGDKVRGFLKHFRGSNWFDAFFRGLEVYYIQRKTELMEFRVVTSDVKGLLEGDPLFAHPDRREPLDSSVRLKVYSFLDENQKDNGRKAHFEQLMQEKGYQVETVNSHINLRKFSRFSRAVLPGPLQNLDFEEARDLGNNIHAYFPKNSKTTIYFYDAATGMVCVMDREKDRVISRPLFTVEGATEQLRYAEFLYNVLAKVHNSTGRTPKVWDRILMALAGQTAADLAPLDLPGLVQLIHKKRKTVPPPLENLDFITKPQKQPHKVALLLELKDPLSLPLLGRLQESPNLDPVMIIGNDSKKGIAPWGLWRSLNHADYEKIYPDSAFDEWEVKIKQKNKKSGEVEEVPTTIGYLLLNGKKIWVFQNLEQMEALKKDGKLPAEVQNAKIELLMGPKVQVDVRNESGKEVLVSAAETRLREILGQSGPMRTYSQVSLFERPGPYRMVVDPLFNPQKASSTSELHFKTPQTAPRLLARLICGLKQHPEVTINNIPSVRLDSQLYYAPPLDKSADKGMQNAMNPFDKEECRQLQQQFNDFLADFSRWRKTTVPIVHKAEGKTLREKTCSYFEVVFDISSEKPLSDENILKYLQELEQGDLKGYLHVYDTKIMGQHVRKQPGVHISKDEGITVTKINPDKNNYNVGLKFWFDRDWEEAGELIHLADSIGFPGRVDVAMPKETELEAERDVVRDFLFGRGTIPPARRIFPFVEFAPEPAAGILEAPTGRIGRTTFYAMTHNLPEVQTSVFLPEYQVGNFNVRFVGVVGPESIRDVVYPISADGTFGRFNARLQWGEIDPNDPQFKDVDFDNVLGWLTVNGSEKIFLIRGRQRQSADFLKRSEIAYNSVLPLAHLSKDQEDFFFLFSASGDKPDEAGDALKNKALKKVLIPQPWKKIKKGDGKWTFVYHASDVRQMWKNGATFCPGSCTTNCATFPHMLNELLFNLPATIKGGTKYLNRRIQRAIPQLFASYWDDFPKAWRENPDKPVAFELYPGEAVTIHAVTNTQPPRNQETRALHDKDGVDAKNLDSEGMNDTSSGVTKALREILPNAKAVNTRSIRINQNTGSQYTINQNVGLDNVKAALTDEELKALGFESNQKYHEALEKYLQKKMLDAFRFGASHLFQGSLRISKKYEAQNAHATRRDSATSIFEESQFRLTLQPSKKEVRFNFKEVLWYDNEWGFTVQVLGLLSELALAMGEETAKRAGTVGVYRSSTNRLSRELALEQAPGLVDAAI